MYLYDEEELPFPPKKTSKILNKILGKVIGVVAIKKNPS